MTTIPKNGVWYDRKDIASEVHSRSYFVNGERVLDVLAIPSPEMPDRWQVTARYQFNGAWCPGKWETIEDEVAALAMLEILAIGVLAVTGGAAYVGALAESHGNLPGVLDLQAYRVCVENRWSIGRVLRSRRWAHPRAIRSIDQDTGEIGMVCTHDPAWKTVEMTFPPDVEAV